MKGSLKRVDHERGDLDMPEPGFTAGSIPVILRISKAMQRRSHKIVKLIQRSAPGDRRRVKKAGKLVQLVHRLALQRIEKMPGIEQIKARSQSRAPPRQGPGAPKLPPHHQPGCTPVYPVRQAISEAHCRPERRPPRKQEHPCRQFYSVQRHGGVSSRLRSSHRRDTPEANGWEVPSIRGNERPPPRQPRSCSMLIMLNT